MPGLILGSSLPTFCPPDIYVELHLHQTFNVFCGSSHGILKFPNPI